MAKKQYKYLPLGGAKLVGRRHDRDVDLPGMKELKNAFVSKSDSAITARPDFNVISQTLPAITEKMELEAEDNQDDFLNSAAGMFGSEDSVYFSNYAPIGLVEGELAFLNDQYSTGTVSCTAAASVLTGSGTSWIAQVWPGCTITFPGDSNDRVYKVKEVVSDTRIIIYDAFVDTYSAVGYSIRQNHQPEHADYKVNIQPYTSGIIYSSPTLNMAVEPSNICGPFYSATTSTSYENTDTSGFTEQTSSPGDYYLDDTDNGGVQIANYPRRSLLYDGYHAWCCLVTTSAQPSKFMRTLTPTNGPWFDAVLPTNMLDDVSTASRTEMCHVDGRIFMTLMSSVTGYSGVAYTDTWGATWTESYNTDGGANVLSGIMSPTDAGSTVLMWYSNDAGANQAWYSADSFATWTRTTTNGSGDWAPGQISGGNYCGEKYIIISGSNAYGSADATDQSWTSMALGDSGYDQVEYDEDGGYWLFFSTTTNKIAKVSTWGTVASTTELTGYTGLYGGCWAEDRVILTAVHSGISEVISTVNGVNVTVEYNGGPPGSWSFKWTPYYSGGVVIGRNGTAATNYAGFFSFPILPPSTSTNFGPRSMINTGSTAFSVWNNAGSIAFIKNLDVTDHTAWEETEQQFDFGYGDDNIVPMQYQVPVIGAPAAIIVGGKKVSTDTWAFVKSTSVGDSWSPIEVPTLSGAVTTFASGQIYDTTTTPTTIKLYHVAAGEDAQTAYYTDDYWDTYDEVSGLSITGSDYIVAVRHGYTHVGDSYLTWHPSFIILTREGKVYYSTDGESFTLSITLTGTSQKWYDCAVTRNVQAGRSQYTWSFIQNISGTHADKALAYAVLVEAGAGYFHYSGQPGWQYTCLCDSTAFETSGAAYGYVYKPSGTGYFMFSGSGSVEIGANTTPYCLEVGTSPKNVLINYTTDAENTYYTFLRQLETGSIVWTSNVFEPLSTIHRSLSHSVLDGYVVLVGVLDYDDTADTFVYAPRRIRWTTPLTYNDFDSIGSGTAELDGSGSLLDSRSVNGRIVIFESSAIGSLSPRGYQDDPWEYDKIKSNIRTISNPVVVDDVCYFIDDSGLLRATNGITVESPPFSFDLTEYDDFNADRPIWLAYSPELESLIVYNPDDASRHVYIIETDQGAVSRMKIAQLNGEDPKSVVCVENSEDRRLMVSFNPDDSADGDTSKLAVAELSTGDTITGKDEWTDNAGDDTYHNVDVYTGQVFIVPEGNKTGIKHLIVNTYTDGTSEATNPILVVQCKSLEDTAWHDNGDRNGTITVTDAACTGDETAWSSTIGASGATVYDTPCLATQARVYVGSTAQTLGTQYTITGTKEITFGSATGDTVYAYWENQPEVVADAGDMIQTTEGWHRVSAFGTATTATLDHYLTTGSDATATHHHGTAFPVGEGQIKIGISKLVEGVKLRFLIFHRSDGDATVTKITGVSVGHVPAGEKIVEP